MTWRAGWDPPEHCPECGKVVEVDMGVDLDLADGYTAPVSVELVCVGCGWRTGLLL